MQSVNVFSIFVYERLSLNSRSNHSVLIFKDQYSTVNHFYNFDSKVSRSNFDISECYQTNEKVTFGIKYLYPYGMGEKNFNFKKIKIYFFS